jgi:hypothetical protein
MVNFGNHEDNGGKRMFADIHGSLPFKEAC